MQEAFATVGDACITDQFRGNTVIGTDVLWSHDARNLDKFFTLVQGQPLFTTYHQIAIRQDIGDGNGNRTAQTVALAGVGLALKLPGSRQGTGRYPGLPGPARRNAGGITDASARRAAATEDRAE